MDVYDALGKLKALVDTGDDTEMDHIEADEILCQLLTHLGHDDVVEMYEKIGKWYA